MEDSVKKIIEILERTPGVLIAMLEGISPDWTTRNEGGDTWSAFDIVGHLIHGELTDWVSRMEIILSDQGDKTFKPFDRFAQFEESKGKSMADLLDEFKKIRATNLAHLRELSLTKKDLEKKGIHPDFGEVTLSQLLTAWAAHDLNHIAQISRVMAKQYKTDVGPWKKYLGILQ